MCRDGLRKERGARAPRPMAGCPLPGHCPRHTWAAVGRRGQAPSLTRRLLQTRQLVVRAVLRRRVAIAASSRRRRRTASSPCRAPLAATSATANATKPARRRRSIRRTRRRTRRRRPRPVRKVATNDASCAIRIGWQRVTTLRVVMHCGAWACGAVGRTARAQGSTPAALTVCLVESSARRGSRRRRDARGAHAPLDASLRRKLADRGRLRASLRRKPAGSLILTSSSLCGSSCISA